MCRAAVLACCLLFLMTRAASAQELPLPPRLDDAVSRGLDYLAKQQTPDGAFAAGKSPDNAPPAVQSPRMATTGLALLAFVSAGHAPDVGRHGLVVRSAIDFLVDHVPDNGYVGAVQGDRGDDSRMYGQGIVTLALAEAYGLENSRSRRNVIRGTLTRMIAATLAAQNVAKSEVQSGGWGEALDSRDSTLWATGWNILALAACKDAGFDIPPDVATRARAYVLKCRNPLDRGFAFQPGGRGEPSTTAIGIVCLRMLRIPSEPELVDAHKFLVQSPPTTQPAARFAGYSAFADIVALSQAGQARWNSHAVPVLDGIVKSQQPDGGWPPGASAAEEPGRTDATALSVLSLTVPYRLLPLYAN